MRIKTVAFGAVFSLLAACGGGSDDPDGGATTPDASTIDAMPDYDAIPPEVSQVCFDGSAEFTRIQEAIDAVDDYTVIEVCPGTYSEHIVVAGKQLWIVGTGGSDVTTILGSATGPTVRVSNLNSAPGIFLEGFTIRGGASNFGGGIQCDSARLTATDLAVTENTATLGGGIGAQFCTLYLTDSQVLANPATEFGGGIHVSQTDGEISTTFVSGNSALQGGGISVSYGNMSIIDNEIRANEALTEEDYQGGGGIYTIGEIPLIENTIAENTSASHGGGAYISSSAADIRDNEFLDNVTAGDGAGAYVFFGTNRITGNTFTGNEALDDAGGLRIQSGYADIEGNTFTFNSCVDDGGAVKFSHAKSRFHDNLLTDNSAGEEGGGVELDNDSTTVSGSTFLRNTAALGGALHGAEQIEPALITTSVFEDNVGTSCGGAIQFEDVAARIDIVQVTIRDNNAQSGGGLCALSANIAVRNALIVDNEANSSGGGVRVELATGYVINSVISGNDASVGAAFTIRDGAGFSAANNLVPDNTSSAAVRVVGEGVPAWTYNDVYGNSSGNYTGIDDPTDTLGNISEDPDFVSSSDYHLQNSSPCIDTGSPAIDDPDNSQSDMGAYGGPNGNW
jgi:hypothetical protein